MGHHLVQWCKSHTIKHKFAGSAFWEWSLHAIMSNVRTVVSLPQPSVCLHSILLWQNHDLSFTLLIQSYSYIRTLVPLLVLFIDKSYLNTFCGMVLLSRISKSWFNIVFGYFRKSNKYCFSFPFDVYISKHLIFLGK